ncbi:uncharacterized protein I206_101310 [Kwoniella pini CBS 10737]|uniref:Thiol methyltransferase 1 n=1 Tax=Kwoniella pini CBS 10737 TaxID=1296096 RepID=A0A1B9IAS9_9TREE|nr:uncharacterized protein I206_00014 [Kwoniella pini CBS 10737]OCF52718.1 hypothetical protein I206_00014 [Kwoniella pini CBS 10737]
MTHNTADNSWEERWQAGRTGWDQSSSHLSLVSLLQSPLALELGIPSKGRALIPGCGTGYDIQTFASTGLDAVGMDLAPTGVEKAKKWLGQQPKTKGTVSAICGDFFQYTSDEKYDLVYDYTFLCAIPPGLRSSWSSQMKKLTSPNAYLITLMYPLPPTNNEPPPWPLTVDMYHELLDDTWEITWEKEVSDIEKRTTGAKGGESIAVWKRK